MSFKFSETEIPGVFLIDIRRFHDNRGFFAEAYKQSDFLANGISQTFLQDNYSYSKKHVLRGLHFQTEPNSQAKLVQVLAGKALDVAVDIRPESKTYRKWIMVELSEENGSILYIPKRFAHGFLAMSEKVILSYKVSSEYNTYSESGIRWNDPDIDINWPIKKPILSEKDAKLPLLSEIQDNLTPLGFYHKKEGE